MSQGLAVHLQVDGRGAVDAYSPGAAGGHLGVFRQTPVEEHAEMQKDVQFRYFAYDGHIKISVVGYGMGCLHHPSARVTADAY